ncbi:MAG: tetratricopeptide repeat protein, partial [Promethearchaeota archaeon]
MSQPQNVNYPPKEIYEAPKLGKKNFEHIILWMLKNNDKVEWSDFKDKPIKIAQSTLSNYMSRLLRQGFIDKIERGQYQITPKGESRFNELSREKEAKRKLSYPPDVIARTRNYEDIILWMAYNNNYIKWSDFSQEPIMINQSSLSKNMNYLKDRNYIKKDEQTKEYRITNLGKVEYSRVLKSYDLDRQSILDEESKRIEEITKRTIGYFEKFGIVDDDIKFRFLNNILTLPFERLKGSLDSEEDFNKVLLFLTMNHPNQYPSYISYKEFSKQFSIDPLDLEFNIRQIVEKDVYSTKFFKIETEDDNVYYFQANEKIEKVLSAITEDHITKFTYLNKLYEETLNGTPPLSLNYTVNSILDEICDSLFNSDLKDSLRDFLPEYIKYLAYRIETERKLVDTLDKLEGVAWRDIPEVFQSYGTRDYLVEQAQFKYYIDFQALKVLNLFSDIKLEKLFEEAKSTMKRKNFDGALEKIEKKVELDPENIDLIFLKGLFLSISNRHQESIRFLENQFKDHQNKNDEDLFIPYNHLMIYNYLTLAEFDRALEISERMREVYPDHPLSVISRAFVNGYKIIYKVNTDKVIVDQVLDDIDHAISIEESKKNVAIYYHFKCYVLLRLDKFEEALEAIDVALSLNPKDLSIHFMKYNILYDYGKIDETLELIDEGIKLFPEKKSKLLTHKAYVYKKKKNYEKGLEIVDELWESNSNDFDALNNKVYYHLYLGQKEEAIKAGKLLTKLNPEDGNFHDSYGEALTEIGDYKEAIRILQKALELEPLGWFTYNTYFQLAKCYKELGKYDLARESLDNVIRATNTCFCGIQMR